MPVEKIYALGPEGTFSDLAARRLCEHVRGAGTGRAEILYTRTIPEALGLAAADADARAVAPIENSETGIVVATQDHLAKYGLRIEAELGVGVRFHLLSDVPLEQVLRIYVHPVAQEQCDIFFAKHTPRAEMVATRSNVDSAVRWAAAPIGENAAAVAPSGYLAPRRAAIDVPDIQNDPRNTTRFVVVRAAGDLALDFTRQKTSLLIEPDADRPGLLFDILSVFKRYDINLCRVESRPARTRPWAYVFYLDITNNEHSSAALADLRRGSWNVVLLGTFDPLPISY